MSDSFSDQKTAVLLLAFGGPDSLEAVAPFLEHVLAGRVLPEAITIIIYFGKSWPPKPEDNPKTVWQLPLTVILAITTLLKRNLYKRPVNSLAQDGLG